uniref:Uncharacterized protein n=1 Tax=Ditylenchus dipsaci TaxID=166011 RepID=A0A915DRU2_9BILA
MHRSEVRETRLAQESGFAGLLVSIFDDNDNYENLASLQPVFEKIKFSNIKVGEQELEVEWFLTGDLKFIDTVYGHLAPQPLIHARSVNLQKQPSREQQTFSRTLFSLDQGQLRFRYNTQDAQTLTQKQQTNLHRECHSVTRSQLLQIPITNIISPSLHLIQGLCQAIIEAIEAAEPSMVNQLEAVFVELQVDKRVWHQRFTGLQLQVFLFPLNSLYS